MKRDLAIAAVAIVVIAAICFGLGKIRPDFKPTPSRPVTAPSEAGAPPAVTSPVVMRINGEPVTEEEFRIAYSQLPEQLQAQFASEAGKQAVAERLVRLKLLEQEGRKQGVDREKAVAAQLALGRTNALAQAMLAKLQRQPSDAEVREFFEKNKAQLESIELSHILIAYRGGEAPARGGAAPPPREQAMQKAQQIYDALQHGGDFAKIARQFSDDEGSAGNGGNLGVLQRGVLPPDIEQVVFAIPEGQMSKPVVSRFGIHIFKVTQRHSESLERVRAELSKRIGQKDAFDRVEVMRKSAKVEFDPKFFPTAKNEQQPQSPVRKPS